MTLLPQWLFYSLIALFLYGLWAFFPKLASFHLPPRDVILYQMLGINSVGLFLLITSKTKIQVNPLGIVFSILGGTAGIIGTFFFIKALSIGKTSIIVTLTALYPVITIALAILILKEALTLKNLLGVAFALAALYLFTS